MNKPETQPGGSLKPVGSVSPYWIEVTFDGGWGKHTRTDDRDWALNMAVWLKQEYGDARVKDSAGRIVSPNESGTARGEQGMKTETNTQPAAAPPLPAPTGSEFDIDAVLDEHREMCFLLMQSVDVMRTTQRLFDLKDGHILMSKCREIEVWLDSHQSPNDQSSAPRRT